MLFAWDRVKIRFLLTEESNIRRRRFYRR